MTMLRPIDIPTRGWPSGRPLRWNFFRKCYSMETKGIRYWVVFYLFKRCLFFFVVELLLEIFKNTAYKKLELWKYSGSKSLLLIIKIGKEKLERFLILDKISVKVLFGEQKARYACEKSTGCTRIEVDRGMSSRVKCFHRSKKCYRGNRLGQAGCCVTRCHGFVTRSRGHPWNYSTSALKLDKRRPTRYEKEQVTMNGNSQLNRGKRDSRLCL